MKRLRDLAIAFVLGGALGHFVIPKEVSEDVERLREDAVRLNETIKRLTKGELPPSPEEK